MELLISSAVLSRCAHSFLKLLALHLTTRTVSLFTALHFASRRHDAIDSPFHDDGNASETDDDDTDGKRQEVSCSFNNTVVCAESIRDLGVMAFSCPVIAVVFETIFILVFVFYLVCAPKVLK